MKHGSILKVLKGSHISSVYARVCARDTGIYSKTFKTFSRGVR